MEVVGTRVSPALGQRIQQHCRGLGKRPSEWLRELVERELAGKKPNPALGDAVQGVAQAVVENSKLVTSVLAISLGIVKTLVRSDMLNHPERAAQIEKAHRELWEGILAGLPARDQLKIEVGVRLSDVASEIARLKGEKQIP